MAKQQSKRRRKRYRAASAYAGDVRPTGVLGVLGSSQTMRIVFILMALALAAGGLGSIFAGGLFTGNSHSGSSNSDFVLPEDNDSNTPEPGATALGKQYAGPPALSIDAGKRYVATIATELGDIQVELFAEQAPQTVNNFVFLARDGFYNGLPFYYVSPGFSAQTGDPTGRGTGGPGYELPQEPAGPFDQGYLGMANGSEQGMNNGSQFFIALTKDDRFSAFTPFGRIISGLDVAERLSQGTKIQTVQVEEQ